MLWSKGISSRILNVATLKPIDENEVVAELKKQKRFFSVEEHNVIGGLGTLLADVIAGYDLDVSLIKIGLPDKFACGFGTRQEVLQANNLDANSIFYIISNIVC